MNRLTERDDFGHAAFIGVEWKTVRPYDSIWRIMDAADRLADYEETGLTPEKCAWYGVAEKEGRLAVLPCKLGDTVYVLGCPDEPIEEWKILHLGMSYDHRGIINHIPLGILLGSIGKTVFLSREEAETALEKEAKT